MGNLVDEAFDEFLIKNKETIYKLFQDWRIKQSRFQTGTKIKINDNIYILACIDGCTDYSWVNIENGTTWGGVFSNDDNAIDKLQKYKWELVYPLPVRKK